ncbi:MAG TPA: hypothetical protein VGG74_17920 [Kofleriaceae bacterium]|jgi:hypothetical protein
MRMLAIVVVLGCHSGAPVAGGAGSDVAAVAALADEACACKDAPCRERLHDRWKATHVAPGTTRDPAGVTQDEVAAEVDHDLAYHAAEMRLYGCLEPDHSAPTVIARVDAFAQRACACVRSDAACLDQVKAELDRYLEVAWLLQDGFTPADKQALTDQMRKFEVCRQVGPT